MSTETEPTPADMIETVYAFRIFGVYTGREPLVLAATDEANAREHYHALRRGFDGAILRVEAGTDEETAEIRQELRDKMAEHERMFADFMAQQDFVEDRPPASAFDTGDED
jgi:hypothetical protein